MLARTYSVEKVELDATMSDGQTPPALKLYVRGKVNSGGWSNPQLSPRSYIMSPGDGILDIDFLAEAPSPDKMVTFGFVDIECSQILTIPSWVVGVRIHASANYLENKIDPPLDGVKMKALSESLPLPWPIPWFFPQSSGSILPLFDIKLKFPEIVTINKMPPVPDKLTVRNTATITVSNNSGRTELLSAATPCDIHHWEVMDEASRTIETEKDDLCLQMYQARKFESGEIIRSDYVVALNGKLLLDGQRYRLKFKFWSFEGEAFFTAKVIQ